MVIKNTKEGNSGVKEEDEEDDGTDPRELLKSDMLKTTDQSGFTPLHWALLSRCKNNVFILGQCPEMALQPVLPKVIFRDSTKAEQFVPKKDIHDLKRLDSSMYDSPDTGGTTIVHILASVRV